MLFFISPPNMREILQNLTFRSIGFLKYHCLHHIINFPNKEFLVLIVSISHKKSGLFFRIGVDAQSEQGHIQHHIFLRDYTVLYTS